MLTLLAGTSSHLTNVNAKLLQKSDKKSGPTISTGVTRSFEDVRDSSTFDRQGRPATTTVPAPDGRGRGINFSFEYDAQGYLDTIRGEDGSLARFEYSPEGKLQRAIFFFEGNLKYVVDKFGRLTEEEVGKANLRTFSSSKSNKALFTKAAYSVDAACSAAIAMEAAAFAWMVLVCGSHVGDCQAAQEQYHTARTVRRAVCDSPQDPPEA